jgi:PAS domain S-box-containing protein
MKSEQRYRLLVNSIPDTSIQLFNKDLRFLIAGGSEIDKSGYDINKVEGHTLSEAYSPEVTKLFTPLYEKALNGESTAFEHSYGQFHYSQQVIPVYDRDGNIDSGMVISTNITERKKFENQLLKIRNRLEILSDTSARLLESKDPRKDVNELCTRVMKFLDCQVFINFLVDDTVGKLHLNTCNGIPDKSIQIMEWLDLGVAVCGCVARDGNRIIAENIPETQDSRTELLKSFGVKAYACHPLMSHDKVIGTLSFGTRTRISFSEDEISLMKVVTDQVATAMNRIRDEQALKESEDRFRTIAQTLPVQISISRVADATLLFANEAYERTFGFSKGEMTGMKTPDLYVNPNDRSGITDSLIEKGKLDNFEVEVRKKDGSSCWLQASVIPITFGGERANLAASIDITENKKARNQLLQLNRTLNAHSKSSQAMMHAVNERKYLEDVCKIIIKDCGHAMVWVGYAENDIEKSVKPVASYGFEEGYIEQLNITWDDSERGCGPTGTAIKTGKPSICKNMKTDMAFKPWREAALKRGYASSLVLPLLSDGKAYGAVSIYSNEPDSFSDSEISMLKDLANDMSYGISYLRLLESEKAAALTLEESEKKFSTVFYSAPVAMSLATIPEDKLFDVNKAWLDLVGIKTRDEIIGKTSLELGLVPDSESRDNILGQYDQIGFVRNIELEVTTRKGQRHNLLVNVHKVDIGGTKYLLSTNEDITDLKRTEKELNSTKNYLENLINYANAPIIVWNPQTRIELFNGAFEHLTGYSSEEVLGKKLSILFPKESKNESDEKIKLSLEEHWETIEIPILCKNKEVKTVLWNSANIYDQDNHTLISTIAQGHDISERKLIEKELIRSREKLDLALNNANIGVWEWDISTNVIEWDERMESIFGLKRGTFEGNYDAFEKFLVDEDLAHVRIAINKALEFDVAFETVYRIKLNDGEIKHINAKALVSKNPDGKPARMIGVCFDITDMKKGAEQALFRLNEDLLRSNKELEQFAYVASHDLQEPLRMISSFTQLLAQRYKDKLDNDANEFIQFAVDGALRMQNLINDLLDYSRVQSRGKSLSETDMNYVLGQTVNNLKYIIKEKRALITNDELPVIYADSGQMVQLLQNLIGNSLKFCKSSPQVHISAKEEQDHYLFSVKDNGIGIEPQYFEKIFSIFQRLHQKEEYAGTGIGLAICRRIVERHGGRIFVESKPGKGSTFSFTIGKNK